jgi:adenosylmethionine-8-amino-7-oxononanoate aminotransferase
MAGGLITRTVDVMHFAPPLIVTREEVDRIVAIADETLTAAEKEFAGEITD